MKMTYNYFNTADSYSIHWNLYKNIWLYVGLDPSIWSRYFKYYVDCMKSNQASNHSPEEK